MLLIIKLFKKYVKRPLTIVIFFEITLLVFLTLLIRSNFIKKISIKTNIAPIEKNFVTCNGSVLKYYCQPKPNTLWSDKPSWMSNQVIYHINPNGFNSNTNYLLEKRPDTFRILALGDSHTFGLWVNTDQNYPTLLEKALNSGGNCGNYKHFEVINLGYPGDDPKYSVYRYQQLGENYHPDLIIWYVKGDDFTESVDMIKPLENSCLNRINTSNIKNVETCLEKAYTSYYTSANFNKIMQQNFNIIKNFTNNYSSKLLFFTYKDLDSRELNFLISLTGKNVYLLSNLNFKDIPRFTNDEHPNAEGYKIIAKDLENFVLSDTLNCR